MINTVIIAVYKHIFQYIYIYIHFLLFYVWRMIRKDKWKQIGKIHEIIEILLHQNDQNPFKKELKKL